MAHNRPLTAAFVRTVTRPGRYGDGGRGSFGLYLRVWHRPNGRVGKSWGQRIAINGRRTNLGLGPAAFVSLAEAREQARENARLAYHGRDPRGDGIPTVAEAVEKVIALHSKGWKPGTNLPSKWRQSFNDYVLPRIGEKPVGKVTTADVMSVLTPIWTTKPGAARSVRQRLGAVMKWAVAKGYREDNPAGDSITAALPRNGGHKHHRAVPHSEVGDVVRMVRASRFQPSARLAVEFVILTATRSAEVRGAQWNEIDMDARLWTIPASRMKGKREHRVPLSRAALEVLREARQLGRGKYIFPARRTGRPLATNTHGNVLRRLKVNGTVHGFRTSFRTWAAEQGVDRQVAELALAHRVKGVEGVYQRSDLFDQRRRVMADWAAHVTGGEDA